MERLVEYMPTVYHGHGQCVLPPHTRILMVIWYLTSSEPYRAIAVRYFHLLVCRTPFLLSFHSRFGTTDSVVHESVGLVCKVICQCPRENVKFPQTEVEYEALAQKFAMRNGQYNDVTVLTTANHDYECFVYV